MALGALPSVQPFRLARDQIAQAICQVRFSTVLRLSQKEALIPLQEALRETYPKFSTQQGFNLVVTPAGIAQQPVPDAQWRFDDLDGSFAVLLTPDFVAIEARRYETIGDFTRRVTEVAELVRENYNPASITRVGLRFINEFRFAPTSAREKVTEAFNPTLLGVFGADELRDVVESSQHVLVLRTSTNQLIVRHGFHPAGGTTVDPGVFHRPEIDMTQPMYVLDIDAFSEASKPFDTEAIASDMEEFNNQMRSFFVWAVEDEYRRTTLGQVSIDE